MADEGDFSVPDLTTTPITHTRRLIYTGCNRLCHACTDIFFLISNYGLNPGNSADFGLDDPRFSHGWNTEETRTMVDNHEIPSAAFGRNPRTEGPRITQMTQMTRIRNEGN